MGEVYEKVFSVGQQMDRERERATRRGRVLTSTVGWREGSLGVKEFHRAPSFMWPA